METKHSVLLDLLKVEESALAGLPVQNDLDQFLYEQYLDKESRGGWKLKAYYALRPFIPRPVQLMLRKNYTARQEARSFPAWPVETVIADAARNLLTAASRKGPVHRLSVWPKDRRFAFVITHDVEWDAGLRIAPDIAAIEKRLGFTSSWNIVPERYPIDWRIVDGLRSDGFEIGVHGLKHDGKLFQSHGLFQKRLKKIHEYAKEWGAVGFRSPATLRNLEWMPELKFEYDSSYFDTDPYEPQPGGCCTVWPYFIGDLVELPMTMPQDHTVFEILGHTDVSLWKQKADWIIAQGGMVLINVHPDYMNSPLRQKLYEEFLHYMKQQQGIWNPLPKDAARWWRDRSKSTVIRKNDSMTIEGPAAGTGIVLKTKAENGILVDAHA